MSSRVYNPALVGQDFLKASFVARQYELKELLEITRHQPASGPLQHVLIIGPRGMGKTSLGLRLLAAVNDDPVLRGMWQTVPFFEESYGVTDLAGLWFAAIKHLAETTNEMHLLTEAEAIDVNRSPRSLASAYFEILDEYSRATGKRLILFVENIDDIFSQFRDRHDIARLRATLQEVAPLFIIGTALKTFAEVSAASRPLYEFFRQLRLNGLSSDETRAILENVAQLESKNGLAEAIRSEPARIEIIRKLTSGNPRLVALSARLLNDAPNADARYHLERLIDDQTPYFKARIEVLPTQTRKVFHALAEMWSPTTSRELAERTRSSASYVSAQLRSLINMDYVEAIRPPGTRRVHYQVKERFYNLYYIYRFTRDQKRRLEHLLDFVTELFGQRVLTEYAQGVLTKFHGADSLAPEDLVEAQELISRADGVQDRKYGSVIGQLLETCLRKGIALPAIGFVKGDPVKAQTGSLAEVIAAASRILEHDPANFEVRIAHVLALLQNRNFEEADLSRRVAINTPDSEAAGGLSSRRVATLLIGAAGFFANVLDDDITGAAIEMAYLSDPTWDEAVSNYAAFLIGSRKYESARTVLARLPRQEGESARLTCLRAALTEVYGDPSASLSLLRDAEIHARTTNEWHMIIGQYLQLGRYREVISASRHLGALEAREVNSTIYRARAHFALGEIDSAEHDYSSAIAHAKTHNLEDREQELLLREYGVFLCRLGRYEKAVPLFEEGARTMPGKAMPWTCLALALTDLQKIDDARAAVERARSKVDKPLLSNIILLSAVLNVMSDRDKDALSDLTRLRTLSNVRWTPANIRIVAELLMEIVAAGDAEGALRAIEQSYAEVLEPLRYAVARYLSRPIDRPAPKEVYDAAEDALAAIRSKAPRSLNRLRALMRIRYFESPLAIPSISNPGAEKARASQ